MAGETLDQIWSNISRGKATIAKRLFTDSAYGTHCPAYGCNRCDSDDCIYSDFIRLYWNHPRFD
jgi:hypothetical protein